MTNENTHAILDILKSLIAPERVKGVQCDASGAVLFSLLVNPAEGAALETLRQKAEQAVLSLPFVTSVTAILTAEREAPDPHGMNKNPKLTLPIKKIIAIASGKGGVGKSTVAVNLAAALARTGQTVGLLDADIYGPSVPRLTGLPFSKPDLNHEKKLIPFKAFGMKIMSIGFMVEPEKAMIWRGPMVQSAIYQMLRDVDWTENGKPLDILVIDLPPGTGDAQLTLAQKVDLDGAIIVSTPQDIALIDAIKAIEMFRATHVPILGLIENMSTHICTQCGHEEHIFGHGGARKEAEKQGIPFLGEIPLSLSLRQNSDQGKISELDVFDGIANSVMSTDREGVEKS